MEPLPALLIGLVVLGAIAAAVWGCLHWVLGPIDRAAKKRRDPLQFYLADLFCLFVLVQFPVGLAHWAARGSPTSEAEVAADVVIGGIAVMIWWSCVQSLSRAGIGVVWRRCIVLIVALPVAFVGSIAVVLMPFFAIGLLSNRETTIGFWLLLAEPLLGGVLYGLGRFTRATVASAEARRNERPPAPGEQST